MRCWVPQMRTDLAGCSCPPAHTAPLHSACLPGPLCSIHPSLPPCVCSMGEICSAYPTSGALYFWSAQLAGDRWAPLASWITG